MKKNFLFSVAGWIGGFLIIATSAHAKTIGPNPIVSTDLAKGTLFVKPNGTGTACSNTLPCDIWYAVKKSKAGDVVFLRGGKYSISKSILFSNAGTSSAPIIFENYPGEKVVFDGSQHAKGTLVIIAVTGHYTHIRGIEINGMPKQGLLVYGNRNVVDGVHVHHSGLSGVQVAMRNGTYGSYNTIRNSRFHDNSGAGYYDAVFDDGGNSDGISISSGSNNRIENCIVYNNSDDGIDIWASVNTYVGYNIAFSNGINNGNGNGFKAGGTSPSANGYVERNLSYSNKTRGFTYNGGRNVQFINNTSWNNGSTGYEFRSDSVATDNISLNKTIKSGSGIENDNSWQRSGSVAFISTDSRSKDFLRPKLYSGFEDIGALAGGIEISPYAFNNTVDLIVSQISYANGIFTSIVKNQGTATIPENVTIGLRYLVDNSYKTWGNVTGPLEPGQSVTIGTKGGAYNIPTGSHKITGHVDDQNKITESNENNNMLSKSITVQ